MTGAAEISLSSMDFWTQTPQDRERSFALLRRHNPVSWQPPPEHARSGPGEATGYWAVVKHADVAAASRDPQTFCAGQGVQLDDIPVELLERFVSILTMDPPRHTRIRRLLNQAFTPRRVAQLEDALQGYSRVVVNDLIDRGPCDFVKHVSYRLPLWTISEMLGIPEGQREHLALLANAIAGRDDDEYGGKDAALAFIEAIEGIEAVGREIIAARKQQPGDDLVSAVVHGKVDGTQLNDAETLAAFVVMVVGANDNTRHSTSHGMKALSDHPEQKALLAADFERYQQTTVEEMLRWATSTPTMRRTATKDTEISGVPIRAGDKVLLVYASANRDEDAFDDPGRFDITRDPNPHMAFGGGGIHFCIGAALARAQLRSIFRELLHRLPDIEAGEPEHLVSAEMAGVKRMTCWFDPSSPR